MNPVSLGDAVPAALRTFDAIADAWCLSDAEARAVLGNPAQTHYRQWKDGHVSDVSQDVLERVSRVLAIYRALQMLLPQPAAADGWVRRPNNASQFGGQSALDRMLSGELRDLDAVREYLEAECGGARG